MVVHEAKSKNMNFQNKNFEYVKKKFGNFLDEIATGKTQYLRSISNDKPTETPANLEQDFPEISEDFRLPAELAAVVSSAHSSPLRVSGPVTMWLHYDVSLNMSFSPDIGAISEISSRLRSWPTSSARSKARNEWSCILRRTS